MKRPPIYLVEAENRQILTETFMRFQEYYESPEFKGRVFTVEEFVHWYASKYGGWTYSRDWYGFNIPSKIIETFRLGRFDPLSEKEKKLLDMCKNAVGDFYVIGATPAAEYFKETVRHEFVHGAFHVNKSYQKEVTECLKLHKISSVKKGLSKMGYHKDTFIDEANAYLLIEPETINEFVVKRDTQKLSSRLEIIFKKHFGFSVSEAPVQSLMNRVEHVQI